MFCRVCQFPFQMSFPQNKISSIQNNFVLGYRWPILTVTFRYNVNFVLGYKWLILTVTVMKEDTRRRKRDDQGSLLINIHEFI